MPTDLRVTDARAAELAALDKAATPAPWGCYDGWRGDDGRHRAARIGGKLAFSGLSSGGADIMGTQADFEVAAAARNALADLLADRAVLIAAVARARRYIEMAGWPQSHDDDRASLMADLGTLLARAEGRDA